MVGQIVNISPVIEVLHKVGAAVAATLVNSIAAQLGAREGQRLLVLHPQRPVRLVVGRVATHVTADAVGVDVVAGPADVGGVVQEGVHMAGIARLALVGAVIGDGIVVLRPGMAVLAACKLIPAVTVTGHAVAISIHTHHDDARLAAAAMGILVTDKGIALDLKVIGMHIDHGMVKTHNHIAAIAAQGNHTLGPDGINARRGLAVNGHRCSIYTAADAPLATGQHAVHGLPYPAHGQGVDKLARCGLIAVHTREPRMVGPHGQCRHQ